MIPAAHIYFRWGTQARRLYDLLSCGPATPSQIVRETRIYNYHQIIDEIRQALEGTGVTVKSRPVNHRRTVWEYRLAVVDVKQEEMKKADLEIAIIKLDMLESSLPRCEMVERYDAASAGGGC